MSSDLYVVLHLPKTAGSTLLANFAANFVGDELLRMSPRVVNWRIETVMGAIETQLQEQAPRTRCAFGHWAYVGIHEKIWPGASAKYITFLREPVERCVSLYGFVKSRPDNPFHALLVENNWTLGEWLASEQMLELHNGQTRRFCFEGAGSGALLSEPHLSRDHLELAKARLREFWFVGMTDTFDEDSLGLYGRMGFRRFHRARVENATRDKPAASAQEKDALAQANALDLELYAFARELRELWLRDHAREVARWRRRAQTLKAFYGCASRLKQAMKGAQRG